MKLTKSQLLKIIKEELTEVSAPGFPMAPTDYNTRPVIIARSVATKLGVDRTEGADWLMALVGDQWNQLSQDRGELWRAHQAFKTAASEALYDLAQEYTERLEAGEFADAKPGEDDPRHPWHDPEEYANI